MKRSTLLALAILLTFVPAFSPVWDSIHHATYTTLGRDQGIFQYVAWAIGKGDVDYREIRDVNGPLIHLIHSAFLSLGGRDEIRFHAIDFGVSVFVFWLAGALLFHATSAPSSRAEALATSSVRWVAFGETALGATAFGIVSVLAISSQYVKYIFWDLAQRESFCDWFLLLSLALAYRASAPWIAAKRAELLAWAAGILSAAACFGKHTYVLFSLVSFVGLFFAPRKHWRGVVAGFVLGGLLTASAFLCYLAFFGDVRAFLEIYFRDAPRVYRFIYHRPPKDIFTVPWEGKQYLQAIGTFAGGLVLLALRAVPARILPILVAPFVGYASIVVQGKGFPYHYHPVSAGLTFAWLALMAVLVDALSQAPKADGGVRDSNRKGAGRSALLAQLRVSVLVASLVAVTLGVSSLSRTRAETSSYRPAEWILDLGRREKREAPSFYDHFRAAPDFFPWEMREAAAYLRSATRPDERVFAYGMDPYLLFLAERRSATRFIYAYDLNYDYAFWGAEEMLGKEAAKGPIAWISTLRAEHEKTLQEELRTRAVGAVVFFDKAPLLSSEDAVVDFSEHSKDAFAWIESHFEPVRSFGSIHVWLPKGKR